MTEPEAQKLITWLATAFPDAWRFLDADQLDATQKLYRYMMRDLDAVACGAAVGRLVATRKKMPLVAEIREATEIQVGGRRALGLEVFSAARKLIGSKGRNRKPGVDFQWPDPVMGEVVEAMGYHYLCDSPDSNLVADRARFIELYDQLASRAAEDRAVAEIAPPIPRKELHDGPRSLAVIVAELSIPKEP